MSKRLELLMFVFLSSFSAIGQEDVFVDVNLDVRHKIDTFSSFDRAKYVTIHSNLGDGEWGGNNAMGDLKEDFLEGYDVYLGRSTGGVQWYLNNKTAEDPSRPGYANPTSITSNGNTIKSSYANKTSIHKYEYRDDQILCNQQFPFFPGSGIETNSGWGFTYEHTPAAPFGTASGEFYGRFIRDSYGTGGTTGAKKPRLIEIMNEPLWPLADFPEEYPGDGDLPHLDTVWLFHKSVAQEVKNYNNDVLVGGYVTAFPDFEQDNFQRWEDRWKSFMDIAGADMDYWALHLYDMPSHQGKEKYRKGSNVEATLDMVEQYSVLKFGHVKPFLVSEIGAYDHAGHGLPWSPYHDWVDMKSINSLMMQFMERPNKMLKCINYVMLKAEWAETSDDPTNIWGARLLRHANEPESKTGDWVYTDRVKTFELWKDINGIRVDTRSNNPDILVDAYVQGDKAYIMINNLELYDNEFKLNVSGAGKEPTSITIREMYGTGTTRSDSCVVSENTLTTIPETLTLKREGTYVLICNYDSDIVIDETLVEEKHYSDTYFEAISANSDIEFSVGGITPGLYGEAMLRIGIGREHGLSLKPELSFNGIVIEVPDNFRGYDQLERDSYFGVIEVPIPFDIVKETNDVILKFSDNGGFVTSVTMQTFEFSKEILRSDKVSGVAVYPTSIEIGKTQERQLTATIEPIVAVDKRISWTSSDISFATVDSTGVVTGVEIGTATITATTADGGFVANCEVKVVADRVPVLVDTIIVTPSLVNLVEEDSIVLEYTILPIDADDKTIQWATSNSNAEVDNSGKVTAISAGSVNVTVSGTSGNPGVCVVNVIEKVPGVIVIDESEYAEVEVGSLDISCNYITTTGVTASGMEFGMVLVDSDESIIKKYSSYDNSIKGTESGTASGVLSLRRATPSSELESGQYYIIEITMAESDGNEVVETISPVILVDPVGISENKSSVKLYPNPASDILSILGGDFSTAKFYDMIGALQYEVSILDGEIDIVNLNAGVYIVVLENAENSTVSKVIIQK